MLIPNENIIKGSFIKRISRFSAIVQIGEKEEYVYLPNPGRLQELLLPEAEVILSKCKNPQRKTFYDLIMIYSGFNLISIDSRIPNKLVYEALKNREIAELAGYEKIKGEISYGSSRLDFLILSPNNKRALIEVKSVTLVRDGIAYFPDAVTSRGVRHITELIKAKGEGYDAIIIFVVQRSDARAFAPDTETDPAFAQSLKQAKDEGVAILPYICQVRLKEIRLSRRIPLLI